MKPKRIQRNRTRGWRMPAQTKYVTRPGRWGNPFRPDSILYIPGVEYRTLVDARLAVELFRGYLRGRLESDELDLEELRGFNLACFCPIGQPCHADLLLELSNR